MLYALPHGRGGVQVLARASIGAWPGSFTAMSRGKSPRSGVVLKRCQGLLTATPCVGTTTPECVADGLRFKEMVVCQVSASPLGEPKPPLGKENAHWGVQGLVGPLCTLDCLRVRNLGLPPPDGDRISLPPNLLVM